MSESKEVATKAETAVAIPKELLGSFVEDSGAGTENIGADDMKIPFLRIAQQALFTRRVPPHVAARNLGFAACQKN